MGRANGVYSLPAGTAAVSGGAISSSKYNSALNDIAADLNTARPVTAGGTGADNAADARANLELGDLAALDTVNNSNWDGTALAVANGGTGLTALADLQTALGGTAAGDLVQLDSDGALPAVSGANLTGLPVPGLGGAFRALKINVTSDSAVALTAGGATLANASDAVALLGALSLTGSTGTSGAGGLDSSSVAASTWYAVYVIYDGTTPKLLLSTSFSAPTLPTGYTFVARLGAVRTDASKNLLRTIQYGREASYVIGTNPTAPLVLASGATANAWLAVAWGAFAPPTAASLQVTLSVNNARGAVAPDNSYTFTGAASDFATAITTGIDARQVKVPLESSNIYFWGYNTGTPYLAMIGWVDNL